ncbi:hypothetical protein [Burkholderia stagnalis]|uniref:hypothetical protein n=1 Tax=Burkholderia stagnalis TaxID=1503054 RepID=UPI000B0F4BC6|nr:hypothetical protein [Burkholderia stagnalis]
MKSDNLVACHECDLLLQRPPRRRPISCAALVEGGVAGVRVDASAGGSGCATRSSDGRHGTRRSKPASMSRWAGILASTCDVHPDVDDADHQCEKRDVANPLVTHLDLVYSFQRPGRHDISRGAILRRISHFHGTDSTG